jgi:hypothetical protein
MDNLWARYTKSQGNFVSANKVICINFLAHYQIIDIGCPPDVYARTQRERSFFETFISLSD